MGGWRVMKKRKSLEEYLDDATENIEKDRAAANLLLADLIQHMNNLSSEKYTHKNFGETAAKYLETLQRSNEQLVKIATIVQKKEGAFSEMSDLERDQIFDKIKEK